MTLTPDMFNALFEFVGGAMKLIDVVALYKDKKVQGISLIPVYFFVSWALWNVFYYPMINQPWSFIGGLFLFFSNGLWLGMALYYTYYRKVSP